MKALEILEILKEYIEDENRLGDLNYAHYSNIIDYLDEAIKELEDMQKDMQVITDRESYLKRLCFHLL